MTTTLKFAVVGLGHIGKRHAEMVRRQPGCELIAGCDVRPKEELGIEEDFAFYSDITEMLAAHAEVDVVCICTPNGLHAAQAEMALGARHHVVIEKPMALNRAEGERVLHKALEVGRQVFLCDAKPIQPTEHLAQRNSGVRSVGENSNGPNQLLLEQRRPVLRQDSMERNGRFGRRYVVYSILAFY